MGRSPALENFLCLNDQQRTVPTIERQSAGCGNLEASRAVCDTLEETVRELREQLRKREQLEGELEAMRNQGLLKDAQICHLEKENPPTTTKRVSDGCPKLWHIQPQYFAPGSQR